MMPAETDQSIRLGSFRGVYLLITVVLIVVSSPMWGALSARGIILFAFGFIAAVGFGGWMITDSNRWLSVYVPLVVLSAVFGILEFVDWYFVPVATLNAVTSLLIYGLTIFVTLKFALFDTRAPAVDRVFGGIAGYFLLGLAWTQIYKLILLFDPLALSGTSLSSGIGIGSELVYYSFITLATQGYGEIVPVNPWARMAAVMEGAVGTLYLAILVANLVSELRPPARSGGGGGN